MQNGNATLTLNNLGVYDPGTGVISAMGTGTGGANFVEALVFGKDGKLYIAGFFAALGAVANTRCIGYWDGTYHAMGTGSAGGASGAFALALGTDGSIYIGGEQATTYGGVTGGGLGKWTASAATPAWVSIGAIDAAKLVNAIAVDAGGRVYFGGSFTSIGGVAISFIAMFNGVSYVGLSGGLNNIVNKLLFDSAWTLYVVGQFTTANGVTVNKAARWTGAAWVLLDVVPPGGAGLTGMGLNPDSTFLVAYNNTGTATTAASTTVTNPGTNKAYPTIAIKGPASGTSRIYYIINTTTGRAIYLNLTINAGETVTLTFTPDNLSFVSDFQGNIASTILAGSNEADFSLQPGANVLSFFAADSTVTAVVRFRPLYDAVADLTP